MCTSHRILRIKTYNPTTDLLRDRHFQDWSKISDLYEAQWIIFATGIFEFWPKISAVSDAFSLACFPFQVGAPDPIDGGFPIAGWRAQPTVSAAARRMAHPELRWACDSGAGHACHNCRSSRPDRWFYHCRMEGPTSRFRRCSPHVPSGTPVGM